MFADTELRRLVAQGVVWPPPLDVQYQPVSIDLRLAEVGTRGERQTSRVMWLEAGQFILGSTHEVLRLPNHIVGLVTGKSTLARRGLMVECAGLVDPGFHGQITLELKNLGHSRMALFRHMPVCQVSFMLVAGKVDRAYGHPEINSHYQGQRGPTPAHKEVP